MAKRHFVIISLIFFILAINFVFAHFAQATIVSAPTIIEATSGEPAPKTTVLSLPAPTLVAPNEKTVTAKVKPLIIGLTANETKVHIWIDGVYNGQTEILIHQSGTASFAYQPFLNLTVGNHNVWVVAEDKNGRKSKKSNMLNFRIEEPMPAPVLFAPVVNASTTIDRPFIVGVALNDSLVKVYVDHILYGQFKVTNHESGTANFAYKPYLPLTVGQHLVYAEAVDSRGKESSWSNVYYFTTSRATQPAISETAVEEKRDTVAEIHEVREEVKDPAVIFSPIEGMVEEIEVLGEKDEFKAEEPTEFASTSEREEVERLFKEQAVFEDKGTGLIDESKEKQGKLQLNLIIFIVFLLGIIAWIIWVNRELIKERRAAQVELEKKEDKAESTTSKTSDSDIPSEPPSQQPPLV